MSYLGYKKALEIYFFTHLNPIFFVGTKLPLYFDSFLKNSTRLPSEESRNSCVFTNQICSDFQGDC